MALELGGRELSSSMMVMDFTRCARPWPAINDGVMGGVSSGVMTVEEGFVAFRGRVSFENNGGFASLRSEVRVHDLSGFQGLQLKVRGDGKTYGLRVRTVDSWRATSYQAELTPPAGSWCEIGIPFDSFVPVFRGRVVADHPALDPGAIRTFGLMIARQEGPFRLDVAWIKACGRIG